MIDESGAIVKGILTSISYERTKSKTTVNLFVRGEDGKRHKFMVTGSPYFYIQTKHIERLEELPANLRVKCNIDTKGHYIGYDGVPLTRIYIPTPPDCPPIRDRLHAMGAWTYEADIPYVNRWLIDARIKLGVCIDGGNIKPDDFYIKPRYWIIDIESLVGTEEKINVEGPEPIICIGIYDSYNKKYNILYWGYGNILREKNVRYIPCATEKLLMEMFFDLLNEDNPDILMGFNLAGYDIPKIVNRAQQLGVDPHRLSPTKKLSPRQGRFKIQGREVIDIYELSRFLLGRELRAHNLDYVNRTLGHGKGKIELEENFNNTWKNDKMKLLRYNKRDLDCVLEIELEQDLITYLDEIRKLTGITYDSIQYKTTIYDMYIMRHLLEASITNGTPREILETNKKLRGDKYPGAYVRRPVPGLYHNVLILDFSSLYPNVFITFNIGHATINASWGPSKWAKGDIHIFDELYTPSERVCHTMNFKPGTYGRHYYIDSKGKTVIPGILVELLAKRDETKKKIREAKTQSDIDVYTKQDAAFKAIVNSAYGVMGKPGFRLYRPDTGAAVTAAARHIIQYTILKAQEMGYNVIYGDTDSIFVELGKDFSGDPIKTGKSIAVEITKSLQADLPYLFAREGNTVAPIDGQSIGMDMETVFNTMAIWAKKNYLGKVLWMKGRFYPDGKYEWKGRGNVRTDTSILGQQIQVKLGRSIVDGENYIDRKSYLDGIKERLYNRDFTLYDIGIPKQIRKNLEEYKSKTTHVRGAIYSNEHFGTNYRKGDKPMWAYIKSPNGFPETDCISFTKDTNIPDGFVPDYKLIVKKQIQPIIDSFLNLMGEVYTIPPEPLEYEPKGRIDFYGQG